MTIQADWNIHATQVEQLLERFVEQPKCGCRVEWRWCWCNDWIPKAVYVVELRCCQRHGIDRSRRDKMEKTVVLIYEEFLSFRLRLLAAEGYLHTRERIDENLSLFQQPRSKENLDVLRNLCRDHD